MPPRARRRAPSPPPTGGDNDEDSDDDDDSDADYSEAGGPVAAVPTAAPTGQSEAARSFGARKARSKAHPHTSVKCCLKGRLDSRWRDDCLQFIDAAVEHVSRITRRGALLFNLVTLEHLRRGALPGNFAADDNFFRQCFRFGLGAGTPAEDGGLLDVAIPHLPALAGQACPRIRGDAQLISYACNAYRVNFKNHVVVNFEARLRGYVRAVLVKHYGKRAPKALAYRGTRYVTDIWNTTADLSFGGSRYDPAVAVELQRLRDKHGELLGWFGALAAKERTKAAWHRRFLGQLELEYWILRRLEVLGGRQFSIAPVAAVRRQHITIDKKVFRDYLFPRLLATGHFKPGTRARDILVDEEVATLQSLFGGARRLRSAAKGWEPDAIFKTDGYSLCVSMTNTKRPAKSKEERKLEGCLPAAALPDGATLASVVGVDMGLVNIFYAAWREGGELKHLSYTRKQYYKEGGITQHTAMVRRRSQRVAAVVELLSETAKRTWRAPIFAAYAAVCSEHNEALWRELGDRRLARSRMVTYMKKTAALDGFVNRLKGSTESLPERVVGCGFPSYNCNAGGCQSAPTTAAFKRLRMGMRTVPVDEFRTSKRCPECDGALVAPRKRNENGVLVEVRGIRLCGSTTCLELRGDRVYTREPARWRNNVRYNRDGVGAANIMRCAGLANAERPLCLRRPG